MDYAAFKEKQHHLYEVALGMNANMTPQFSKLVALLKEHGPEQVDQLEQHLFDLHAETGDRFWLRKMQEVKEIQRGE